MCVSPTSACSPHLCVPHIVVFSNLFANVTCFCDLKYLSNSLIMYRCVFTALPLRFLLVLRIFSSAALTIPRFVLMQTHVFVLIIPKQRFFAGLKRLSVALEIGNPFFLFGFGHKTNAFQPSVTFTLDVVRVQKKFFGYELITHRLSAHDVATNRTWFMNHASSFTNLVNPFTTQGFTLDPSERYFAVAVP